MFSNTRTLVLCAAVSLGSVAPVAVLADGHTNAFPGNKGYVGHQQQQTHHKKVKHQRAGYVAKQKRPREVLAAPVCPPNFTGMFRGTMYCSYGKPLR